MTEDHFTRTITKGIYRDDDLVVFSGVKSRKELKRWRKRFQRQINEITGGNFLQFTVKIWMPPPRKKQQSALPMILEEDEEDGDDEEEDELTKEGKAAVKVVAKDHFLFLDMKLLWDIKGNLEFKVYRKKGQALKYDDKQSLHRQSVFKSISKEVFTHLIRLTSVTEESKNLTIDKVYPEHTKALQIAGLTTGKFPTLENLQLKEEERKNSKNEKEKSQKDNRTIYFILSHSKIWGNSTVPRTIKKLQKRYKLNWLRVQMAYSRFLNIREKFNGDLVTKINKGTECRDFGSRDCNCTRAVKINGKCAYKGRCRQKCIVYKCTCKFKLCFILIVNFCFEST